MIWNGKISRSNSKAADKAQSFCGSIIFGTSRASTSNPEFSYLYTHVIGSELIPLPCPYSYTLMGIYNGNGMMCGVCWYLIEIEWGWKYLCQWRILWIQNWLKGEQIKGPFMFLYLFRFDLFCDWNRKRDRK